VTRFGSLRRPGALVSVTAAGLLGVGLAAVPASAHTPHLTVDCSTATVDLSAYNGNVTNHVKVTVQGDDSLTVDQDFKDSFHKEIKLPDHTSPVEVHLVVTAGDGSRYNDDETKKTPEDCAGPSKTPAPPSSAPATPSAPAAPASSAPVGSAPAAPSKAPSSPAAAAPVSSPSPAGDNLAETGSSSSTPIIAGAAAVVVIAGAGILWASRRRRASQS
jgi:LPXTG-motif cell wall-anchored protein